MFGLVQGQANVVAPGKRPLSSMSPTIVLKDGRPVLTLGASGGPRIITAVMQVMLNVVEFDLPLEEAMSAVRLHHQWQPDEVYFDRDPPQNLVAGAGAPPARPSAASEKALRFRLSSFSQTVKWSGQVIRARAAGRWGCRSRDLTPR